MKAKSSIPSEILDPRGPLFALVEHEVDGLQVLDRDLVVTTFAPERRANWVGVDRDGRLVLVLFVDAGDETTPNAVIAALAFGAESRAASARRWRVADVRADLEPLVVVVAPSYTTRTLRSLSFLSSQTLIVLELRTLETAGVNEPFLVRLRPSREVDAAQPMLEFGTFPAAVRPDLERLSRDMKRVDPEIEAREAGGKLLWLWRGDEIAHVSAVDGVLVVSEAKARAKIALDDVPRREAWLERFLVEHCTRRSGAPASTRPLDLLDRSSGPLLSAEELDAFRE